MAVEAKKKPAKRAADEGAGKGPADPKPKLMDVRLDALDPDPAAGVRDHDDVPAGAETVDAAVKEYAAADREEPGCLPPVEVFRGPGQMYLGDGGTRFRALAENGREVIAARVRTYKTDDEARLAAVLFACGANTSHGRRRSDADKRSAVRQYLTTADWAAHSDKRAEAACRVHNTTVRSVRADLTREGVLAGTKVSAERYTDWDAEAKDWKEGRAARGTKLIPAPQPEAAPPARAAEPVVGVDPGDPAGDRTATTEVEQPAADVPVVVDAAPPARAAETAPQPAPTPAEPTGPDRPIDVLGDLPADVARQLRISQIDTVGKLADKLNRPGTLPFLTREQREDLARRLRELDAPAGKGSDSADAMDVALSKLKEVERLSAKLVEAGAALILGPLGKKFAAAAKGRNLPLVKRKRSKAIHADDYIVTWEWPGAEQFAGLVADVRAALKPDDAHEEPAVHTRYDNEAA